MHSFLTPHCVVYPPTVSLQGDTLEPWVSPCDNSTIADQRNSWVPDTASILPVSNCVGYDTVNGDEVV